MKYKQILKFPQYYVCDDGFVYKDMGQNRGLMKLKGSKTQRGYKQIVLHDGLNKERYLVHRLVAEYFIDNPDHKPYVDHIDTDVSNNAASNLRWVTAKENQNNVITHQHMIAAQRESAAIPLKFKKEGITIEFDNQFIAEQYFKTTADTIMLRARTNKPLFGFTIQYNDNNRI